MNSLDALEGHYGRLFSCDAIDFIFPGSCRERTLTVLPHYSREE
jgi:hypothetical protein